MSVITKTGRYNLSRNRQNLAHDCGIVDLSRFQMVWFGRNNVATSFVGKYSVVLI